MMEAVNGYYKLKEKYAIGKCDAWRFAIESLLMTLSPFAPHITEEIWQQLGYSDTIHVDHWPTWDDKFLVQDSITVVVQVNGKLRAKLNVSADISESDIKQMALADKNVQTFMDKKEPTKVIYVPGRLVNIVV